MEKVIIEFHFRDSKGLLSGKATVRAHEHHKEEIRKQLNDVLQLACNNISHINDVHYINNEVEINAAIIVMRTVIDTQKKSLKAVLKKAIDEVRKYRNK